MKRIKKLFSVILAMAMTLAMTLPTMAAGVATESSVNVTLPEDDTILAGHTFTAFQIFIGTQGGENILGDVQWGDGIEKNEFVTKLQGESKLEAKFNGVDSALGVAGILSTLEPEELEIVAQIAYDCRKGAGIALQAGANTMTSGYYLIVDTTADTNGGVYNAALLQATDNVEVQVKTDKPHIEKKIVSENGDLVDYNNVAIGDTVSYVISSNVPNIKNYKNYKFKVVDTLSEGLTFGGISEIKIGKTELTENTDYTVKTTPTQTGSTIEILFNNFKQYEDQEGALITIKYNATLNEKAKIGVSGNTNEVVLQYSVSPNEVGEGDEFTSDEVKGETPKDTVITYTTGISINKIDGKSKKPLTGAQFQITGTALVQGLVTGFEFVPVEEPDKGDYYKLTNGSYTTTDPTPSTESQYESTSKDYTKVDKDGLSDLKETDVKFTAEVNDDGVLEIKGLSAGEYKIKEIKAPDGYNILEDSILVEIKCDTDEMNQSSLGANSGSECKWSIRSKKESESNWSDWSQELNSDGLFVRNIENNQGTTLPETGGIGTTIFYIIGGILVVGAAVLLVTKKRMSREA